MVQFSRNSYYTTTFIHFPTLIKQLGNEQVVLNKIPKYELTKYTSKDSVEIKEKDNSFNEEKKAESLNKTYCTRCDKIVVKEKSTQKFCSTCYKILSYKCMDCNLLFSNSSSLSYHLEHSCKLSASYNSHDEEKNKKTTVKCMSSAKVDLKSNNEMIKSVVNTEIKDNSLSNNLEKDENCNLIKSHDDSLELKDSRDLNDSFTSEANKDKYYIVPLQTKSKALRTLCIPCKSRFFDPETINCTNCKQTLTVKCTKCEKEFPSLKDTVCHLEICNPIRKFCCSNCEYKTTERHFMKEHIKGRCEFLLRNTEDNGNNLKICENCKQAFVSEESFKVHQGYCASLSCDFCPYKTKHKASLTMHMKTHAKIRKLKNGHYNVSLNNMVKHNADILSKIKEHCVHCGQDHDFDGKTKKVGCSNCKMMLKWKCKPCGKLYASASTTIYHIRTSHVKEPQVIRCINCQKEFVDCWEMKIHMKNCILRTGIKCEHCDFLTKYIHKMKIHHKEKHPDLLLNENIENSDDSS